MCPCLPMFIIKWRTLFNISNHLTQSTVFYKIPSLRFHLWPNGWSYHSNMLVPNTILMLITSWMIITRICVNLRQQCLLRNRSYPNKLSRWRIRNFIKQKRIIPYTIKHVFNEFFWVSFISINVNIRNSFISSVQFK